MSQHDGGLREAHTFEAEAGSAQPRAAPEPLPFLGYFVELAEELLLRDQRGLGSWPCKVRR